MLKKSIVAILALTTLLSVGCNIGADGATEPKKEVKKEEVKEDVKEDEGIVISDDDPTVYLWMKMLMQP